MDADTIRGALAGRLSAEGARWLDETCREVADEQGCADAHHGVGDDALQKASQGRVVPDSFTHGTSEQRQRWFYQGFRSGDPNACDTFNTDI